MRLCMLRAGLTKAEGADNWVMSHPKAWLGTAYHGVLEAVTKHVLAGGEGNPDVDGLWHAAVDKLHQRVQRHLFASRFGEPTTWPGYYLVFAHTRQRAKALLENKPKKGVSDIEKKYVFSEHAFTAFGGKLVGRPDLIRDEEILDYKTGEIFEEGPEDGTLAVKTAYTRQLRIYGFLVATALGVPIRRGVLLPMIGSPVEVELDSSSCAEEAVRAVALLDRYNTLVSMGRSPEGFASPCPESCCWCPYQAICPALWKAVTSSWFGKLECELASGTVTEAPKLLYGKQGFLLRIHVHHGTGTNTSLDLSLNASIHAIVRTLCADEAIRIVGLGRRRDGGVFPSIRTVVVREASLPELKTIPSVGENEPQGTRTRLTQD